MTTPELSTIQKRQALSLHKSGMSIIDITRHIMAPDPLSVIRYLHSEGVSLKPRVGRKPKLTQKEMEEIALMYAKGYSVARIAKKYRVSRPTVDRVAKKLGAVKPDHRRFTADDDRQCYELFMAGESFVKLAQWQSCSKEWLRTMIIRHCVRNNIEYPFPCASELQRLGIKHDKRAKDAISRLFGGTFDATGPQGYGGPDDAGERRTAGTGQGDGGGGGHAVGGQDAPLGDQAGGDPPGA